MIIYIYIYIYIWFDSAEAADRRTANTKPWIFINKIVKPMESHLFIQKIVKLYENNHFHQNNNETTGTLMICIKKASQTK